MIHVFIDLEFCTCFRKSSPLRTETIEVGAVKTDEDFNIIGEFDRLVRPDFCSSIPSAERNLTGITWAMVENESSFCDVMEDFVKWMGTDDYMIYSWSNNDPVQVLRESRVKGFPAAAMGMFKKWVDFQQTFMTAVGMKNQISLERAIELADLYFIGEAHRAVVDSYNTARLFAYCSRLETVDLSIRTIDNDGSFAGNNGLDRRNRKKNVPQQKGRNGRRNIGAAANPGQMRDDTAHLAAGAKPKTENRSLAESKESGGPDGERQIEKSAGPGRRSHRGGRKKKKVV